MYDKKEASPVMDSEQAEDNMTVKFERKHGCFSIFSSCLGRGTLSTKSTDTVVRFSLYAGACFSRIRVSNQNLQRHEDHYGISTRLPSE